MPMRLAVTLLHSWRQHILAEMLGRVNRVVKDPLRPPPTGRTPDTVFICGFMIISGIGNLILGPTSTTIDRFGSIFLVLLWNIGLIFGAALTITGAFWKEIILGLFLELLGRITLLTTCLLYLIAVWDAKPVGRVALGLLLIAGLVASSAWRIAQLASFLRWIRLHLDEVLEEQGETE